MSGLWSKPRTRRKYNVIKVDWSDPEQLRHLLWQRVVSSLDEVHHEDAWAAINPEVAEGVTAVDRISSPR